MVGTKEVVGEFLGTYILVLTVGCNVMSGSGVTAGFSIAASLMVMIYALGSASGANFNPAVSLALCLSKEMPAGTMATYMVTQIVAGISAGMTYASMFGFDKVPDLGPAARPTVMDNGVPAKVQPYKDLAGVPFGAVSVLGVEVLYTFFLVFVVLRAAVSKRNSPENEYFPIAIAFTVIAGAYGAGAISGGCFNPAVAIGLDVTSAWQGVEWCIPYALAEFFGAALAVGFNMMIESESGAPAKLSEKCLAEFIGTFFLVLTVGLNVCNQSPAAPLSIAASLIAMIYAVGNTSGAHLNPAVSTALILSGRMEYSEFFPYVVAQLFGGLAAGLTYASLCGIAFPLAPGGGHSWWNATFAETVFTFLLCFTVLNVAALKKEATMVNGGKSTQIYGLAIGFCIVAGGWAIGGVSGGSLNPAVSLGLDTSFVVMAPDKGWSNCLAYSAFEIVGAGLAAVAFSVLRPEEFSKDGPKRVL